jgi:hypothetical protein
MGRWGRAAADDVIAKTATKLVELRIEHGQPR